MPLKVQYGMILALFCSVLANAGDDRLSRRAGPNGVQHWLRRRSPKVVSETCDFLGKILTTGTAHSAPGGN